MATDLKQSIECTRKFLFASLNAIKNEDNKLSIEELATNERLARPSFAFMLALFRLYVLHPRKPFAGGLYDESELDLKKLLVRKDKIRVLFKMLACVAMLTKERVDVMVSPVKILSGTDVSSTLFFIRHLARASRVECNVSSQAAKEVSKIGEGILYKQSVKIRSSFIAFQAITRGRYARRQLHRLSVDQSQNKEDDNTQCHKVGKVSSQKKISNAKNTYIILEGSTKHKKAEYLSHGTEVVSYDAQARSKSKEKRNVEIQKHKLMKPSPPKQPVEHTTTSKSATKRKALFTLAASDTTKVQIGTYPELDVSLGRARTNRGGGTWTESISAKNQDMKTETFSAVQTDPSFYRTNSEAENTIPTPTKERRMKKIKIVNGVRICQNFIVHEPLNSSDKIESAETKMKLSNIRDIEEDAKRRLMRLKDKEERLDCCMKETRQKEEHLRAQEDRCMRLADNLRNQQERVKKDGIRQSIELDKLRLQMSKSGVVKKNVCSFEPTSSRKFSPDLLMQASTNATITDLRLALERKERALIKRHERLSRAENKLRSRMIEIENIAVGLSGGDSKVKNTKYRITKKVMKQKAKGSSEDKHRSVNVQQFLTCGSQVSTTRTSQICLPMMPEQIYSKKDHSYSGEDSLNLPSQHDTHINDTPQEVSIDASLETIKEDLEEKSESSPRLVYRQHSMPRSLVDYTQHYETYTSHVALPRSKSH